MIDEHIISTKFGFNSFNATCGFNTKAHFSKIKVFMNWNVWHEWYNGKKTQGEHQIELYFHNPLFLEHF
jgi:hypothetical protein